MKYSLRSRFSEKYDLPAMIKEDHIAVRKSKIIEQVLEVHKDKPILTRGDFFSYLTKKCGKSEQSASMIWKEINFRYNLKPNFLAMIDDLYVRADAKNDIESCIELLKVRFSILEPDFVRKG